MPVLTRVTIRLAVEQREEQWFSQYAFLSQNSRGRRTPEELDPIRTCFQRDRDRILHSKPFRRLKHKTQVFVAPAGDHYRTRLTHSLEVAQISRTIGRALRLNEDLIEAIALGHDVGHTPFGHAGEQALDEVLKTEFATDPVGASGFQHWSHSLRVLDELAALNLTEEVRGGIGGHSKGRKDLTAHDGEPTSTLEAAVVRIGDRIAYMNHDLDDAMRAGIVSDVPDWILAIGETHGKRITAMVSDVVGHSVDQPRIATSRQMLDQLNAMKEWLFDNVYLHKPEQMEQVTRAQKVVKDLFRHFASPGNLPPGYDGLQGAIDYVAGMTDRFALESYTRLFLPREFAGSQSEAGRVGPVSHK